MLIESDGQPRCHNGRCPGFVLFTKIPSIAKHNGMNSSPALRSAQPALRRTIPALIVALAGFGTPACSAAQEEKTDFRAVAHDVVALLMEYHYSNTDFEDELGNLL